MSNKPLEIKPPEKQPGWSDWTITRLGGLMSLIGIVLAMGYLILPLAYGENSPCAYRGDVEIHEAFKSTYAKNCLVMGPPISRIAIVNIDGYGDRTIQYFEGALLMGAPAGNPQTVEIFPLGEQLQPKDQQIGFMPDAALFEDFLKETGNDQFLGEKITDFLQIGERLVVYYENTSIRWNLNSQTISYQSLGRDHLLNHYPGLLIEGELTQLVIPTSPLRFFLGDTSAPIPSNASDYIVNVAVKYPVLYSDNQQVVTVEVINRISNEPVHDLTIVGSAQFADLINGPSGLNQSTASTTFRLEPTDTKGTYVATINLPDHPQGKEGREVIVDVSFDGIRTEKVSTIKKFQTWW